MKAYSKEKRGEVLADCDAGILVRDVAQKHRVSESWIRRIKQERREQNNIAPDTTRKRTPKWAYEQVAIQKAIESKPDMTLQELKREIGTDLSVSTLCRALQRLKLTLKKKS